MDTHKECCSNADNSIGSNICDVDNESLSNIIDDIRILYKQKIDKLKVENIFIREDFAILQETSNNRIIDDANQYKQLRGWYDNLSSNLTTHFEDKINTLKLETNSIKKDLAILQETSNNKIIDSENKLKELQIKYDTMSEYLKEFTETHRTFKSKVADLINCFEKK